MTRNHLVIGLFEKDTHRQALLHTVLSLAGHTVKVDHHHNHSLPLFLQTVLQEWVSSEGTAYDLLLVDIALSELRGETLIALEQWTARKSLPLIVLTEADPHELEMISANVRVLPFFTRNIPPVQELFALLEVATDVPFPLSVAVLRTVRDWQRDRYHSMILSQQAWLDQRKAWLQQRLEWIDIRQAWLGQRFAWIEQQRRDQNPQHEWLNEQQKEVEGHMEESRRQRGRTLDQHIWINLRQKALDHLKQHLPFQTDEEIS